MKVVSPSAVLPPHLNRSPARARPPLIARYRQPTSGLYGRIANGIHGQKAASAKSGIQAGGLKSDGTQSYSGSGFGVSPIGPLLDQEPDDF